MYCAETSAKDGKGSTAKTIRCSNLIALQTGTAVWPRHAAMLMPQLGLQHQHTPETNVITSREDL